MPFRLLTSKVTMSFCKRWVCSLLNPLVAMSVADIPSLAISVMVLSIKFFISVAASVSFSVRKRASLRS